jgi:hypothetical protein
MFEQAKKNAPTSSSLTKLTRSVAIAAPASGGGSEAQADIISPRRDGRLRGERRHHPDRSHQPSMCSPALLRQPLRPSGRGPEPDVVAASNLKVHVPKVPSLDVNLKTIARGTPAYPAPT